LKNEDDPYRRQLLLEEIRRTEVNILSKMRREREILERQNINMEEALQWIKEMEKGIS